jgi:hypothetical protein
MCYEAKRMTRQDETTALEHTDVLNRLRLRPDAAQKLAGAPYLGNRQHPDESFAAIPWQPTPSRTHPENRRDGGRGNVRCALRGQRGRRARASGLWLTAAMSPTHVPELVSAPSASEASEMACANLCRCTGYGGIQRAISQVYPLLPPTVSIPPPGVEG